MKRSLVLILMLLLFCNCSPAQNLGKPMKGTGERVSFNRLSLIIPADWYYSKNPREVPGTDQLQLFSADRNRTVMITVTNARPGVDFIEVEHSSRFQMLKRAMSMPQFKNCSVVGKTPNENMWGRKGILSEFELYKDESHKADEIMMRLYNYGEQLASRKEVLFITAFVIGKEEPDTDILVKSMQLLNSKPEK